MKKTAIKITAVLLILITLSGCRNGNMQQQTPNPNVPNPIKTYAGVGEMNKALGFNMITLPPRLGFVATDFETISDRIGQLTYAGESVPAESGAGQSAAVSHDDLSITLRMAKGEEDISGIYGVDYGTETIKSIDINVGIYKNSTYIAWWVYNDFSYSVTTRSIDNAVFNSITDALVNEMLGESSEE